MTGQGNSAASLTRPFWEFENDAERRIVRDLLYRRFPRMTSLLADSFTAVSTDYDIAHPENPDSDNDVIVETLVLLAEVNGNLDRVSTRRLHDILGEGMARSLGHTPKPRAVKEATRLISTESATIDWGALTWEATDFDGGALPEDIRPLSPPFLEAEYVGGTRGSQGGVDPTVPANLRDLVGLPRAGRPSRHRVS
ncbi:MAG TPA: hypothetical protein VGL64_08505 [Amycolatopsis sp.]|jgi:hypothetical protein